MTAQPDIVAWQPLLTDHQAQTFEELVRLGRRRVVVLVTRTDDAVRQAQGWTSPAAAGLDVRVIPSVGWYRFVFSVLRDHTRSIHLFGSPFEEKRTMLPLFLAAHRRLRVYLISEPYSPIAEGYFADDQRVSGWLKAKLRPALYRGYGLGLRGIEGVFAISRLAMQQYRVAGIPAKRVHPFGYFVRPRPRRPATEEAATSAPLRVVFVGSLIARKGVDELLQAIQILRAEGVEVTADIYGTGVAARYSFDGQTVNYRGSIPFGGAQDVIARYDALVAPSRYDGWGVVVNEALLAGVPVVCSDGVGASGVIEKWKCGVVCPRRDPAALAAGLRILARDHASLRDMRAAAVRAAGTLVPAVAARYMEDVFEAVRRNASPPTCPWYDA